MTEPSLAAAADVDDLKRIVVPILADKVDHQASVDALHPASGRAVIEETGVPAVVGEGAAAARSLEAAAEFTDCGQSLAIRDHLDINVGHIGLIPSCRESSPVAMAKARGIEDLHYLEVPGTQGFGTEV